MKLKNNPFLKAVPIIYALFILLLLIYHFSRFEEMSLLVQNVSYKGTRTAETGLSKGSINNLSVFTNGLQIDFSKRKKLQVITEDDIVRELSVQELEVIENGIILHFKYDISLKILSLNSDSSLEASVPLTIPPVKELIISASAQDSFQINQDEQKRIMLSDGTSSYFLDSMSGVEYRDETLIISMQDHVSATVSLKDEAPGLGRTAFEWLADTEKIIPEKAETIMKFKDQAYKGWTQRFDKNTGNLKMPEGIPNFSEKALVYYLSEMYNRNEETLYASDLLKAADKKSSDLTWYSSPFTGDVVIRTAALLRTAPSILLSEIHSVDSGENSEVSPYKEIMELKEILSDPAVSDPVPWIEENIYPLIVWLEEGLYIFHPENPEVCSICSLKAAELLEEAAEKTADQNLMDISAALRHSILSRAEADGTLPSKISFSRERASMEIGKVPAERVYSLYKIESFSPRIIDLSDRIGSGTWLYTVAESSSVKKLEQSIELSVRYPVGQIHHLVIKGVEPFDRILLHDIRWKSDPRFQRYSDGWAYNSVNKTLYIKVKHRKEKETIRILYDPPKPETAAEPAVSIDGIEAESTSGAGSESSTSEEAPASSSR
jgi:hypothetical protein